LELTLDNIGKKYQGHWLFKDINLSLSSGQSLSVTGKNGSGKSTLMQVVYGLVQASEGKVLIDGNADFEAHVSMAMSSPYMDLPMEFSIREIHQLYGGLKKIDKPLDLFCHDALFASKDADKPVKYFSSGMLQRLKTAFCLYSTAPIILLDEPLTNMDATGEKWYKNCLIEVKHKICLVAGNQGAEIDWTDKNLSISEW
jgi:ABC-type multidrug transport system ATPase subunit